MVRKELLPPLLRTNVCVGNVIPSGMYPSYILGNSMADILPASDLITASLLCCSPSPNDGVASSNANVMNSNIFPISFILFQISVAKIVQAERRTKQINLFFLPRRRLSYSKIVQAAFVSFYCRTIVQASETQVHLFVSLRAPPIVDVVNRAAYLI